VYIFFKDEEVGFVGSSNTEESFFKDVSYIVAVDRKGNSDILVGYGNLYSEELTKNIPISHGYQVVERDTMCDSSNLTEIYGIASINISCGYYNPHTKDDFVVISELFNTIDYLVAILNKTKVMEYKADVSYGNFGAYAYESYGTEGVYQYDKIEDNYIYEVLDDMSYVNGIDLVELYQKTYTISGLKTEISDIYGLEIANSIISDIAGYGIDVNDLPF